MFNLPFLDPKTFSFKMIDFVPRSNSVSVSSASRVKKSLARSASSGSITVFRFSQNDSCF